MKKYSFFLIGLLVAAAATAQPEAVFNKIVKNYTVNADGSQSLHYQKELTLNTHIAFNNLYGETFVVYNPEFQTLKINESYTKQADGAVVKTPNNAFNEVLPSFADDAPAYNHLREMVITHTGLELGATIYLDYTLTTKSGFYPAFDVAEVLQDNSPIESFEFSVTLPKGQKLNYELAGNNNIQPTQQEKDGKTTYSWVFKDLPAAVLEQNVSISAIPILYATTDEGSKGLARMFSALKIDANSCKSIAQRLTDGKKTDTDKLEAIQKYVADEIANCRVPYLLAGKVRDPKEVLASACGTEAEKTALLLSMLQAAGIKGEVLGAFPANVSVMNVSALSGLWVKAANRFCQPTQSHSTDIALGSSRFRYLSLADGTMEKIEEKPLILAYKAQIALNDTTAKVTGTLTDSGNPSAKPDFSSETAVKADAGFLVYALPQPQKGVDMWIMQLNSKRTQPMLLPSALQESCDYELTLDKWTLKTKTFEKELSNAVGKVRLTMQSSGATVTIHREIEFSKSLIQPNEYEDFRALVLLWKDEAYRTILVKN